MEKLMVPIGDLSPDPNNARVHHERSITVLMESLDKFGYQKPIVASRDGIVYAGNGTFEAAKRLGWTHIPVSRTDLKGVELAEYAIADNRTGELSEWDYDKLSQSLTSFEGNVVVGFDAKEYEKLTQSLIVTREPMAEKKLQMGSLEYRVVATCNDEKSQIDLHARLTGEGYKCLLLIS